MTSHSSTPNAGQGLPGRRSARPPSGWRRRLRRGWPLAALAALLLVVAGDAVVLTSRMDHLDVELSPTDADGSTWVLVGVDSRADLPAGADVADFGTTEAVPGARADVVVVVHRTDAGAQLFSVPRDVVSTSDRGPERLALSWLAGPASTVHALCALGIPTDHLVSVDLAGFAAVVDAVGGLDVDVPQPVRDPLAGLELPTAGRQHVDGATALAMVRSRHPEHPVGAGWAPAAVDPDGRAVMAGTVLQALTDEVRGAVARPWRLQATAWAASGALALDPDTGLGDLASLARADLGPVQVLPVGPPVGETIVRLPTQETRDTLAQAGMSCTP